MGLVCQEIGQAVAVNVCHDLHAQYHILVQSDDSRHCICYPDEQESFALCQNGEGQAGQLVVVDAAS